MIADYFKNFDLSALVSSGNSGNTGNMNSEAPDNEALPVTIRETADKSEWPTRQFELAILVSYRW